MSITWNGVNSDTIGVIVERIPNRYVPTRRFSPQQVAGRNGNILLVDKAFPNVEQEYEVYLSAEAQGLPSVARACAEWLMGPDGYCRLEDSYDTTVYREAFLLGGFDIENILNKFGRCTITFSCKPQKYLLTGDTPIEIPDGTTTTYTGDVVQFDVITGASITSLSTTITPTQDLHGYASPWPGGGGKNLLPEKKYQYTSTQVRIGTDGTAGTIYNINLKPGTYTLTVTANVSVTTHCKAYFPDTGTYGNAINIGTDGGTFTITDEAQYNFYCYKSGGLSADDVTKWQLEAGNEATSWVPFENICPITGRTGLSVYVSPTQDVADATTYAVDWTSEAGTVYGGTLDVVTGVLTVDWASVDMGSLSWSRNATYNVMYAYVTGKANGRGNLICSNYKTVELYYEYLSSGEISGALNNNAINVKDDAYTSAADFKTAMNGVQLVYELATPLTYQLTPKTINLLAGIVNYVWSSSGDVSVTVTTPLGGTVTNPTPFEARPLLEVSGVGEITINGKTIQILESVSDFEIDCETMEAEDNSKIYCMDFPELSGGENKIVGYGSITALTVTPRWWTL